MLLLLWLICESCCSISNSILSLTNNGIFFFIFCQKIACFLMLVSWLLELFFIPFLQFEVDMHIYSIFITLIFFWFIAYIKN